MSKWNDSVGDPKAGAANRVEDVKTVQGLLNVQIIKDNRSDRLFEVTGRVNDDTLRAIVEFQRRREIAPTVVIQPDDSTFSALMNFSGPRGMRATHRLADLLKSRVVEGFAPYPYNDASQPPNATIGYGHKLHSGPVTEADRDHFRVGITSMQADQIFRQDLGKAEGDINQYARVPLSQNQFDALASLVFNIGSQFNSSTLLEWLNVGDYLGAGEQFLVWIRAGSAYPPGLARRRREERALFLDR